jgi:hypothetical protein
MVESEKLEWPELRQHQLILEKAAPLMAQMRSVPNSSVPVRQMDLLGAQLMLLTPRASLGAPVVGDVASYYSTGAAQAYVDGFKPPPEPPAPPTPLPFNVQHVVVSFIFGVLVAALVGMQWQVLRRRRPAQAPGAGEQPAQTPTEAASVPSSEGVTAAKSEGVMQEAPPS